MRSQLIALVLCVAASTAWAQCTAPATPAHDAAAHPGGELIKTAAAGTRDGAMQHVSATMPHNAQPMHGEEHPHRSGTAMLLAALALMSGIALRRSSTNDDQ